MKKEINVEQIVKDKPAEKKSSKNNKNENEEFQLINFADDITSD